jgi:hypothetical protein
MRLSLTTKTLSGQPYGNLATQVLFDGLLPIYIIALVASAARCFIRALRIPVETV